MARKIEAVVDTQIDAMKQLNKINENANWLLDHVMRWIKGEKVAIQALEHTVRQVNVGTNDNPEYVNEYKFTDPHRIAIQAMGEIRNQMKLQLDIYQKLYDLKAAEEFQTEVLEAIGEVAPDVRKNIIHNLNEKRAIYTGVKYE